MSYTKSSFYNYSTLGTNCLPKTIAVTSNTKFLSPLDSYYYKNDPIYNLNFKTEQDNEHIYSEFNVKYNETVENGIYEPIIKQKCSSCSSY